MEKLCRLTKPAYLYSILQTGLRSASDTHIQNSYYGLDDVKIESVGGTLKEAEKEALKEYSDSCKRSSGIGLSELIKTASENLRRKYPGTTKTIEEMLGETGFEKYERRKFSDNEILPGDICRNDTYFVYIPDRKVLDNCLVKELEENKDKSVIDKITGYTQSIYKSIAHFLAGVNGDEEKALDIAWGDVYKKKILSLEDTISGKLPAACFEQALALNYLVSRDPEIRRLGGVSTLDGGYHLNRKGFGEHAWVILKFPKTYPEQNINSAVYILDATAGKVFEYNKELDSTETRYVQEPSQPIEESTYFIFRRRVSV